MHIQVKRLLGDPAYQIGGSARRGLGCSLANRDTAGGDYRMMAQPSAVRTVIPARQLLVYEVKDGWEPLCSFLGAPVPDEPFPRTNARTEFWDRVSGVILPTLPT